jgi:DUF1680 family protein
MTPRTLIAAGILVLPVSSSLPAPSATNEPVRPTAEMLPLSQVRLLPGPFQQRQQMHLRYLLMIEPDRLLAGFREQAGLPAKAKRYGGWEAMGIHGHSLGHYLSAISLMYAATGNPQLLQRVRYIVDELAACQQANGDGYVCTVPKKVYEDIRDGKIKASGFSLNDVWVPNYTLHKVLAGLRDAHRYSGNTQALDVARKLADWLDGILRGLTDAQIQEMLKAEHGGMNEVLADLGRVDMAEKYFYHRAVLDPMLRGEDRLNGLHANTQIPKVIGLARLYELTGNPQYRQAAEWFWDNVVHRRSYCIGGHGEREHFFPPEQFPQKLTPHTAETCNTYNMLKLTGHLFAWQPKDDYMDFVERAMINHLLANLGQQPGEFGYFLSLAPVGLKVFSTPFDSWWCCVGTGLENPARYGEWIYFAGKDTLYVNLFIASELNWNGVTLRQQTRFPEEDKVRFTVRCDKPVRFTLKLRQPAWCDKIQTAYTRTWNNGDTIEVRLPMKLRFEPLPHSDGKIVAAMYGPMVLAGLVPGAPGRERYSDHLKAPGKTDAVPPVLVGDTLKPTGRFAEFRSKGAVKPDDLTFVPLYRVYEEPYAVYFPKMTRAEWDQREADLRAERETRARQAAATLDTVEPGFQQSEVGHALRSDNSHTGDFRDRKWRDARDGWFSYEMAVDPERPTTLVVTYWGGETQERNFDILVDGDKIATQRLRMNNPGAFFDMTYPIPSVLTKGKSKVTVRFQAHPGSLAGGVFGLRTMRSE